MPPIAPASGHVENIDALEPQTDAYARASTTPSRVGFAPFEKLQFEGLTDDPPALSAWATDCANSLVAPDREQARLRLIARAVASERARMVVFQALLDQHMAARDWIAVREVRAVIAETTRTLCALLREHAAACRVGQRAVLVAVAHADAVHVSPMEE